jgi:hypothetical protein
MMTDGQCIKQECSPPPPPTCGPWNCSGCCDSTGTCQIGVFDNQCGSGGSSCFSCQQFGEKCLGQQCASATCDAQTCPSGCCDAQGVCEPGFSDFACGGFANFCQNCGQFGESCINQQCQVEGGSCNPQNCPFGCCDQFGTCQSGTLPFACGNFGGFCQNCLQFGEQCNGQQCFFVPDTGPCNQFNCNGCCDQFGTCQSGSFAWACGAFGNSCQNCAQSGEQCNGQQCVFVPDTGTCNQFNCKGCCDQFGTCQLGTSPFACGAFGNFCQDCAQFGEQCNGQACFFVPDTGGCNQFNCGGCCDQFGVCQIGNSPVACGAFGNFCQNCAQFGEGCDGIQCSFEGGQFCNAQTCSGCCDAHGVCQPGFVDNQCGEQGGACSDCTALNPPSTCDVGVFPRGCTSQQMQCPAPYQGCQKGLIQSQPFQQKGACSAIELQNAAAACSGGAHTNGCSSFFSFEFNQNFNCANCLQQFDFDFTEAQGVLSCVAPFVDANCNHNSACVVDCVTSACNGCLDPSAVQMCESSVSTGTCQSYFQAADCVVTALGGGAAACNPATYMQNYGAWLQGVGGQYCE